MRGQLSLRAKIFLRRHKPFAEMDPPDAIHHDARRERIFPIHHPARKAEAIARLIFRERQQPIRRVTRDDLAGCVISAALEQMRDARLGQFLHDHDFGNVVHEFVFVLAQLFHLGERILIRFVVAGDEVVEQRLIGGKRRKARAGVRVRERSREKTSCPARCQYDFGLRERNVKYLQVVNQSIFETAVAEPGRKRERVLFRVTILPHICVTDVLGEFVAHDFGFEQSAVAINLNACRATRTIVGHGDVRPFVPGQNLFRANNSRIARPEMDEAEQRLAVIKREFKAATARIRPRFGLMKDDGAILLLRRLEPEAEGESIRAQKRFNAFEDRLVVAAELERGVCVRERRPLAGELRCITL